MDSGIRVADFSRAANHSALRPAVQRGFAISKRHAQDLVALLKSDPVCQKSASTLLCGPNQAKTAVTRL